MERKRNWSVLCPFCGRAYKLSSWGWILRARPRGCLGIGQPQDKKGKFMKADTIIVKSKDLDRVVKVRGLFDALQDRLFLTVRSWLGHGWITLGEMAGFIMGLYRDVGGFRVYDFGPGFIEPRVKRDKATPIWYPKIKLVKSNIESSVWR